MLHTGPRILWNIRTGKRLFEYVAELKYLGMRVTIEVAYMGKLEHIKFKECQLPFSLSLSLSLLLSET